MLTWHVQQDVEEREKAESSMCQLQSAQHWRFDDVAIRATQYYRKFIVNKNRKSWFRFG